MASLSPDVSAALASLRTRWGAAAPRVIGSLAVAAEPEAEALPGGRPQPADPDRVIGTGFAALDAILGPGGIPRDASVALCGDPSSGRTTLALQLVAAAQAGGSIAAWVDLARSLDPVEAVARGVNLEWLVVLEPGSPDEGLAMAGSLLAGRTVDVLVIDLPDGLRAGTSSSRTRFPSGCPIRCPGRGSPERPSAETPTQPGHPPRTPQRTRPTGGGPAARPRAARARPRAGRCRGFVHRPAARAGSSIVDPARAGCRRPADRGRGRPEPVRAGRSSSRAADPVRGRR